MIDARKIEVSGTGNIVKAEEKMVDVDLSPAVSEKPEFNPNSIANALLNEEKEGGVFKAVSTGAAGLATNKRTTIGFNQPEQQEKWELFGCHVQYTVPDTKTDIASEQVRLYFNTKEEAIQAVSEKDRGKGTTATVINYKNLEGTVSLGHPCIAYDDILKFEYVDRAWKRP